MAEPRTFEIDDLVNRPGTYYNPQTDVVIIVDDTVDVDTEVFNMEEIEGASDWVLLSDEAPVDEARRDEIIERFQVTERPVATAALDDTEEEQLEADEEPDELSA